MRIGLAVAVSVAALSLTACASQEDAAEADGTWVGTITTEGNVATVVNESGSVWGGTATLVEEASIGVESGPDEYMFGWVSGLAATDDQIYAIARDATVVRVYDLSGNHLFDMGNRGQGPGEFLYPSGLWVTPTHEIVVQDRQRLNLYSAAGEPLDTWSLELQDILNQPWEAVAAHDGVFYTTGRPRDPATGSRSLEMVAYGPEGSSTVIGPLQPPDTPDYTVGDYELPYAPEVVTSVLPSTAFLVGAGHEYRFEVRYPDGRVTVIQKDHEPVAISEEERDWHRARVAASRRRRDPDWRWSGPDIPAVKPAYRVIHPDASGRLWVLRDAPSEFVPGCDEDPAAVDDILRVTACWRSAFYADVFEEGGRFLGTVPDFVDGNLAATISYAPPRLFIRDDMVLARVEDGAGTIMVKRYRLVLPGEEER